MSAIAVLMSISAINTTSESAVYYNQSVLEVQSLVIA